MMQRIKPVLGRLFRGFSDWQGYPESLRLVLSEAKDLGYQVTENKSIDQKLVTKWYTWSPGARINFSGPDQLHGWGYSQGAYQHHSLSVPELATFGRIEQHEDWVCDIRQVLGITSSKSELYRFMDLDEFALSQSAEYTALPSTPALIQEELDYGEVRITTAGLGDSFAYYSWDHRVFLNNSGGSKHFATARYHAGQCRHPVELRAACSYACLDTESVRSLCMQFHIFSVRQEVTILNEMHKALMAAGVTFYWGSLPEPHGGHRAYFFPKNVSRSNRAAEILRNAGIPDLGAHLLELAVNQSELPSGPVMGNCHG